MRAYRLGCLTSTGFYAALIAALMVTASAFARGGSMFSPGALNAEGGNVIGGVSSHAEIAKDCKACHTAPWDGDTMDQRCSSCHVDVAAELLDPASVHGRMQQIDPKAQCLTCHPEHNGPHALLTVIEGWQFPHEVSRFSLMGHQLTAEEEPFLCTDCHGEDVTRFDQRTCNECHLRMDMAFMVEHQFTYGEDCLVCHDGVDRYGNDFDHNQFPFKLTGMHASAKCSQCHLGARTISDLQATSQDCLSCHAQDDAHQGSLGPDCAACHSTDGWSPSTFDHDTSVFKLTGAHAQAACETCHLNGVFKGTPQDCFSCHQQDDAHMGQLGPACESCHTTDAWQLARFDHSTTRFKLTGSHLDAECKACHANGVFKNTPMDCFSCHASRDVHKGEFGRNCAACHQTTTWAGAKFNHNATGFPLSGNHARVSCGSCHKNDVFKGAPQDCFSCHAKDDKHNGQLGTSCSICHTPAGWKTITFDHNTSAFPLTGKHIEVECTQCHLSGRFKIPTECVSCHREPAFHEGALGTICTQCHKTESWTPANFVGTHPSALGQNFLDHHGATCRTCHTTTVREFTCLVCHETNPLSPADSTPLPAGTLVATEIPQMNAPHVVTSTTSSTLQVGDTYQISVYLKNIPSQGYASTEFTCTYDPALVEVGNIGVGSLFGADPVTEVSGPQNGSFIFAVAGSNGRKAAGGGIAFTFSVKGSHAGQTNIVCKARVSEGLDLLQSIDSGSSPLTISARAPISTTMPAAHASITGQVLASREVTVQLLHPDRTIAVETTANSNGMFTLTVPGGAYTITATAKGFLGAQVSITLVNGGTLTMSAVHLIPGDIDNNGVIDQMDAITIRMNYGGNKPASADLNRDGVIDVLDLGILAENYGRSGALLWE